MMTKSANSGNCQGDNLEEQQFSQINVEVSMAEKLPTCEGTARIVPGSKEDPYRSYRFLKQSCIIATWISIGLYAGLIGPTLPDLRDSIGVDMDQISATLMFKTIGFLTGALVGGFLFNVFHKKAELIMLLGIIGMATIAFAPWGQSLGAMCFFFWTAGTAEGIVNVGGNPMVMHLWEEKAPTPLLLTHFGFGLGSVIAPLLARPFIAERPDDNFQNTTTVSSLKSTCTDQHLGLESNNKPQFYAYSLLRWDSEACWKNTESGFETNIKICYAISGILILCISLYQLYFVLKGPPKGFKTWAPATDNVPLKQMLNPGSCAPGGNNPALGIQLLTCLFLFFGMSSGGQSAYADFLYSFATESKELEMSESEAASLNSAFWLFYSLGRLAGGLVANWVPVPVILGSSTGISILIMAVLLLFGETNRIVFWTFSCLFAFDITILFPTGMAWANVYLRMNSMSTMVLLVGSSAGRAPLQYLAGYVYEEYGPNYIMYVSLVAYGCCMADFAVMQMIASCCHKGMKKLDDEKEDKNGEEKVGGGRALELVVVSSVGVNGKNPNIILAEERVSEETSVTKF